MCVFKATWDNCFCGLILRNLLIKSLDNINSIDANQKDKKNFSTRPGTRGAGLTGAVTVGHIRPPPQLGGQLDLPDGVRQEAQAPGQLDLLPQGEGGDGPLEGDGDGPVAQVELAERHPAGLGGGGMLGCRWGTPGRLPSPSPRSGPGPPP